MRLILETWRYILHLSMFDRRFVVLVSFVCNTCYVLQSWTGGHFMMKWCLCLSIVGYHIVTKFCTCHDNIVMPWAKFHCDHFNTTWLRLESNFCQIWIAMEKLFMKWVHIQHSDSYLTVDLTTFIITLTHWGRDKMVTIFQTTFSKSCCWIKMFEFRLKFHWILFLRAQ